MRKTLTMIVAAGAILLVTVAGVAVAQNVVRCDQQSPDVEGGACKGTKGDDVGPDTNEDGLPDTGIVGTWSDDRIDALGGSDRVDGHYRDDTVEGGGGGDYVIGGGGKDTLYEGKGRDTLRGGGDTDTVYGGPDDDKIEVYDEGYDTSDTVSCGGGKDTVYYDKLGTDSDKIAKDCEVLKENRTIYRY